MTKDLHNKIEGTQKAKSRKAQKPKAPVAESAARPDATIKKITLPSSLPNCLEEHARCFFLSNYVVDDVAYTSHYDCLPRLQSRNSKEDVALSQIIYGLGLLGLSNAKQNPELATLSYARYVSAIRLVNAALRDPSKVKSDETLVSVLLLSLYENTASLRPDCLRSWIIHTDGATALLELRGKSQVESEVGRHLLRALIIQNVICSMQRRKPIPKIILELNRRAYSYGTYLMDFGDSLIDIAARFCDLRANLSRISPLETIATAVTIDLECEAWLGGRPAKYHYNVVQTAELEKPFADSYHVYPDIRIASFWNSYRSFRILLHGIILKALEDVSEVSPHGSHTPERFPQAFSNPSSVSDQAMRSKKITLKLAADICHSVLYCMCDVTFSDQRPPPKALAGGLLIWPLYTVGEVRFLPLSERDWVIEKLERIATETGIQQALKFGQLLRKGRDVVEIVDDATSGVGTEEW
ncbi:MAG: hypothetical protein MMC33_007605 [Icmadophila ericetorum]|nr:hypothetical protein [Icmadophila ericetorum]